MSHRWSLLGLWFILLLLASSCEPVRFSSNFPPNSKASLPAVSEPQTTRPTVTPGVPPVATPLPSILARVRAASVKYKETADIQYAEGTAAEKALLSLDIYAPTAQSASRPVMVYIHGGGWSSGDKKEVNHKPQFFVDAGFIFVSVNYRLTPKVKFPTHAYDVAKAIAWIHQHIGQYGGDPQKISLIGHSAGGHLAVLVSTDERYLKASGLSLRDIRSVISLDTAGYDLTVFAGRCKGSKLPEPYGGTFGQVPADLRDASPTTYIDAGKGIAPMIIVYSGDVGIGSSVSRELMAVEFTARLQEAGIAHALRGSLDKNHSEISTDFGKSGDELSEQVLLSLEKIAPNAVQP